MWVRSLGWEDLLEEGMATHSSILAQGQRSLVGYGPQSLKESDMTDATQHARMHRAGQSVHLGFSVYQRMENPNELFGQPNTYQ